MTGGPCGPPVELNHEVGIGGMGGQLNATQDRGAVRTAAAPDRFGLSCALTTPFDSQGACDVKRLVRHAWSRLEAGCSSVTVFGTTGEGASLGASAREAVLAGLAASGMNMRKHVVVGIAASNVEDAANQIRQGLSHDCRALLVAPPFYFKNVSDDGICAWFSSCFEAVGTGLRDVILYHIPSVTQVPLSIGLIGRLKTDYPAVIAGVKDSSGDWPYSRELLERHKDLMILIGDERHLAEGVALGAQGSIAGTANIFPELLTQVIGGKGADSRVPDVVAEILKYAVTPAVKTLVAHVTKDEGWIRVAPPLESLGEDARTALIGAYDRLMGDSPRR